jgi:DNA mismatch repair protein MutH
MRVSVGQFTFDNEVVSDVMLHANRMEGKTLRELSSIMSRPDLLKREGKGAAGQLIQRWFGIEPDDTRAEPDLPNVVHDLGEVLGVEIKAVSLRPLKRKGGLAVKERSSVGMIDYSSLLKQQWLGSHARNKLCSVLFVFYEYAGKKQWADSTVRRVLNWRIGGTTEDIMRVDWQAVWQMVNEGRAHELSESLSKLLSATTKGPGGRGSEVSQPKSNIMARRRAFALKPAFLRTQWGILKNPSAYKSIETLTGKHIDGDLQSTIIGSLSPFVGKPLGVVAKKLGIEISKGKSAASLILRRALGINNDKIHLLELEEAGVNIKTVPVTEKSLMPLESMSFPAMNLQEFAEEDWEDSEFLSHIECLLILPVFAKNKKQPKTERILRQPFFWTPTPDDWEGIEKEWRMFQKAVKEGHAKVRFVTKNGKTKRTNDLPQGAETHFIHTRPHSRNAKDFDVDPLGNKASRLSFWFNSRYIQEVLRRCFS